jgi:gamma-glutamylcyclotransferase (GGCT)/AIG2-like uncharacterized protein YtfP
MEEIYLFVYGTLMKKFPENPFKNLLSQELTYVGEAYTYGKLFLVDYYPGFIPDSTGEKRKVWGEILKVKTPEIVFGRLDEYEDFFPDFKDKSIYTREMQDCFLIESEIKIKCNVYFYNQPTCKLKKISSGNFIDKKYK